MKMNTNSKAVLSFNGQKYIILFIIKNRLKTETACSYRISIFLINKHRIQFPP